MLKIWIYIKNISKYLLGLVILSVIISYLFPMAGKVIFILGALGAFSAVKEDVEASYEEALREREHRRILKVAEESKDEFEGFEQALILTRRNMD